LASRPPLFLSGPSERRDGNTRKHRNVDINSRRPPRFGARSPFDSALFSLKETRAPPGPRDAGRRAAASNFGSAGARRARLCPFGVLANDDKNV